MAMTYIVLVVVALYAVSEFFHRQERTKLINRLMAKSLSEFKYYEDKWKPDLKEVERLRAEAQAAKPLAAKETDLSKFEEPWEEEDNG